MDNKFVLDWDTMMELETFSAKFEQFRNFVDLVHEFVWQEIMNGFDGERIDKLGCLSEMMSEIVHNRDNELETIIKKINPLPNPVKE